MCLDWTQPALAQELDTSDDTRTRAELQARYDRVTARIRDFDTLGYPIDQGLYREQERLRRRLDGMDED